jgi:hypothetical protein
MQQIYRKNNILHTTTTPYMPYENGKVENESNKDLDKDNADIVWLDQEPLVYGCQICNYFSRCYESE